MTYNKGFNKPNVNPSYKYVTVERAVIFTCSARSVPDLTSSEMSTGSSAAAAARISSLIFRSSSSNRFFGCSVLVSGDDGAMIGFAQNAFGLFIFLMVSMWRWVIFGTRRPFRAFRCFSNGADVWIPAMLVRTVPPENEDTRYAEILLAVPSLPDQSGLIKCIQCNLARFLCSSCSLIERAWARARRPAWSFRPWVNK